ncbi:THAP domain-containing protein 5-like [Osmerus mordax]|uniref:THAP domain-containing protein 5-like n=1 Tax=Osmerus mordax TaxID=8014 RepID=UPI0035109FE0
MPKYCTAPNCKNDSGNTNSDRKSFYKFPLHDPERLEQWLKNMGREDWIPSRHQYICHDHFTSSCFKLRWGIRYLENDAVPTVFQKPEKRKGMDHFEKYKRRRYSSTLNMTSSDDGATLRETLDLDSDATVQLYEITVDPSQFGEPVLVESRPSVDVLLPLSGGTEADYPLALFQTVEDLGGEHAEVVIVSEGPYADGEEEGVSGIHTAIHTADKDLFVSEYTGSPAEAQASLAVENVVPETKGPPVPLDDHVAQVIAYFETIPNVLCAGSSTEFRISPDTVLSSALSSRPIVSTLPIVSKHTPPSPTSLILTLERIETVGEEGERDTLDDDDTEQQGSQLEEHRYHKNSLSKEQLEAIVIELQKKVKILQQRHRRHLDKLLGLEATVSQLRQNNILNEERLQLLERAYLQTSAAVTDAGETVAIIYEDNTAYLYTQSNDDEEEVRGWDGITDSNSQL